MALVEKTLEIQSINFLNQNINLRFYNSNSEFKYQFLKVFRSQITNFRIEMLTFRFK
jgi:hypothetical protein